MKQDLQAIYDALCTVTVSGHQNMIIMNNVLSYLKRKIAELDLIEGGEENVQV